MSSQILFLLIIIGFTGTCLSKHGLQSKENSLQSEKLQPLKLPSNISIEIIIQKLAARSGHYTSIKLKHKHESMDSLLARIFKKTSFRHKFKAACDTDLSHSVSSFGHQKCYEKCHDENRDFVRLFNRGFQKMIHKLPDKEKIRIEIMPTYSKKISACVQRKHHSHFSCRCRPEYVFMVNSYFQKAVDDVVKDNKMSTRGLINTLTNSKNDVLAFILYAIIQPIEAFKFLFKYVFVAIPGKVLHSFLPWLSTTFSNLIQFEPVDENNNVSNSS